MGFPSYLTLKFCMPHSHHETVSSLAELYVRLERLNYQNSQHIYRGLADETFDLTSSASRFFGASSSSATTQRERTLLNQFKRHAYHHSLDLDVDLNNDMELMMLAQHYGLPTRLIDFSMNPLIALYFACRELHESDGRLWILAGFKGASKLKSSPWDISKPVKFIPPVVKHRLSSQSGVFVIPPSSNEALETIITSHQYPAQTGEKINKGLYSIKIDHSAKGTLLDELDKSGVSEMTLFPGLDSVAKRAAMTNYFNRAKSTASKESKRKS
jgi:hypothetical protein